MAQSQPQLHMGQPQIAHTQLIQLHLTQLTLGQQTQFGQQKLPVGQASVTGTIPQFNQQIPPRRKVYLKIWLNLD